MIVENFNDFFKDIELEDIIMLKGEILCVQGNVSSIDKPNNEFEIYITDADDENFIGETLKVNINTMETFSFGMAGRKMQRKTREQIWAEINYILELKPLNTEWLNEKREELMEFEKIEKLLKSRRMGV